MGSLLKISRNPAQPKAQAKATSLLSIVGIKGATQPQPKLSGVGIQGMSASSQQVAAQYQQEWAKGN